MHSYALDLECYQPFVFHVRRDVAVYNGKTGLYKKLSFKVEEKIMELKIK